MSSVPTPRPERVQDIFEQWRALSWNEPDRMQALKAMALGRIEFAVTSDNDRHEEVRQVVLEVLGALELARQAEQAEVLAAVNPTTRPQTEAVAS